MDIDLEAILRTFKSECDEHLVRMEEALIVLETDPDDAKCLEAIFRGAHTIKGNAAGLGYVKVGEFAHAFEELLQRLHATSRGTDADDRKIGDHGSSPRAAPIYHKRQIDREL